MKHAASPGSPVIDMQAACAKLSAQEAIGPLATAQMVIIVELHRAECLEDTRGMFAHAPYVRGQLHPSQTASGRTMCVVDGATSPIWDDTMGNKIVLAPQPGDYEVRLYLCNGSINGTGTDAEEPSWIEELDAAIGVVTLRLEDLDGSDGTRAWYPVDSGGRFVELEMLYCRPPADRVVFFQGAPLVHMLQSVQLPPVV